MLKKINNITLDYQKGVLWINDEAVTEPILVKVKEPDGWDITKLFNSESAKQGTVYPELVIDAREIMAYSQREELKELVRNVLKEIIPAELAGAAGTNC